VRFAEGGMPVGGQKVSLQAKYGSVKGMREETLAIFQRYVPGFTQAKEGHFVASRCPFCGEEDAFLMGMRSSKTGEFTDNFLCLKCDQEGSPEDLIKALGGDESEPKKAEKPIDGLDFGKIFPSDEEVFTKTQEGELQKKEQQLESFSNMGILKGLVDKNLSGSQFRIALLLALNGNGLTVEQISRTTKIPLSSVYRALKGNRVFHPTSKNTYILKSENEDSQTRETKGSNHG